MFTVNLKPGLRFKKEKSIFQVLKLLPNQIVEVRDEEFGDIIRFTYDQLIKSLSSNDLKFEVKGKNIKKQQETCIYTDYMFNDIENIKDKEKAIFKFRVIEPLLNTSNRSESDVVERVDFINILINNPLIAKEKLNCSYFKKVSRTSVYRWIKEFEESNRDFRSLVPGYYNCGGKGQTRFEQVIIDYIKEFITRVYMEGQRISKSNLFYHIRHKINEHNTISLNKLEQPSYSTICRYIDKIPEFDLVSNRYSKKDAENKFGFVGGGVKVSYPLERVEIDTKTLDIIIVGEDGSVLGRPNFITAIDKRTGNILGFHISFGKTGWKDTMQCMRHIMTDKSYIKNKYPDIENSWTAFGVPKTIVVDNGKEFKNRAMEDACLQLGIILEYAPPRVPQWKGSIERFFGTSDSSLVHNLPGTTRSNPQQLADGENPSKLACLTLSHFTKLIHKWIIDVYIQDLNRGVNGIPSKLWDKYISEHPVAWPNNIDELAVALGKVEYRSIRNTGILLNHETYNCYELHNLYLKFSEENNGKDEKFKVKYDPLDISCIYVYDHLIDKKWIKVPSTNLEYTRSLSEWEHLECIKRSRAETGTVDIDSLSRAKFQIYQDICRGDNYSRQRIAQVKGINSSNEIFGDNYFDNSIGNSESKNTTITIDPTNLSDIGNYYQHSDSGNSVIIPFQELNDKKKSTKKIKSQKSVDKHENSNDLISDKDLEGFSVSNLGVDRNDL